MNVIFNFLMANHKEPTLPKDIIDALHRHFFLTQRLGVSISCWIVRLSGRAPSVA